MNKLKVLIMASRPVGWIIAPLIFLAALTYSGAQLNTLSWIQFILLSFPFCLFVYGINDVYDYKSDRLNGRKYSFHGIKLDKKYHKLVNISSFIVFLLFLISAFLTDNGFNILSVFGLLFFGYYYSAKPFRFKTKALLDSISNGLIFLMVIFMGYSFGGSIFDIESKFYWLALGVVGIHSFSTIMDYSVDRRVKDYTFAVKFGKRTAASFSLILFLLILFFSGFKSLEILLFLIYCSFVFLVSVVYPNEKFARGLFVSIFFAFLFCVVYFIFN